MRARALLSKNAMRPFPDITESLDELERRLRQERHPLRKQRLHLLVLIKREAVASQRQAADYLAVHRNTVGTWLGLYRAGGLTRLLQVGTAGAPRGQRLLPPEVFEALQERLDAEGFASYLEAQHWIEDTFGLLVNYKSLHKLIRYRLGAKLKRSRPRHPKRTRPKRRSS
jgi:transposase